MYPELTRRMAIERITDLRREAARYRRARAVSPQPPQPVRAAIQLRLSACRDELERLGALSRRTVRDGDWLVADVDGTPVAAVSIEDGTTLYDPYRPALQAVSLLELRRRQVRAAAY